MTEKIIWFCPRCFHLNVAIVKDNPHHLYKCNSSFCGREFCIKCVRNADKPQQYEWEFKKAIASFREIERK